MCLAASQEYESNQFGKPVNNEALESIRKSAVPMKTRQSMLWAVNIWGAWVKERKRVGFVEDDEKKYLLCDNILEMHMSLESLSSWLLKFVMEVRKESCDDYSPDSIYGMCCGLQRELRMNDREDVYLFVDSKFRQVLDGRMKHLKVTGNFKKKQADVITEEVEDSLWDAKLLGDNSPQALIDTVFFYILGYILH